MCVSFLYFFSSTQSTMQQEANLLGARGGSCLKKLTRGVNLFTGELRKINKMAVLGIVFLGGGEVSGRQPKQYTTKNQRDIETGLHEALVYIVQS